MDGRNNLRALRLGFIHPMSDSRTAQAKARGQAVINPEDVMKLRPTLKPTAVLMAGLLAIPAGAALAQQTQDQPQLAEECLGDLNQVAQRMQEDQFWLTGWGGGYGVPGPQSTRAPAATSPATGATTDMTGSTIDGGADPRGMADGIHSPRHQIRALYSAARVLAHRGEEEGCAYITSQLSNIYDQHIQRLTDAGIDPASVTHWRQEQVALAQPIGETESLSSFRVDDLTGTDVRNLQDESLGTVSDVLIDPNDGSASYILVARGGFLGIGEEHFAVPWNQLRATPGLDVVVLDRTAAELDQAPAVDPDRFRDPTTRNEERQRTDQFWTRRG